MQYIQGKYVVHHYDRRNLQTYLVCPENLTSPCKRSFNWKSLGSALSKANDWHLKQSHRIDSSGFITFVLIGISCIRLLGD